jgi:hypothetical protein
LFLSWEFISSPAVSGLHIGFARHTRIGHEW